MIFTNVTSHQWGQMLVVAVWKHASTCIRHMNRHHMRIHRLRLCLSQPALLPRLKQQGFTSVGLIISEAMLILETFQVEHTRISDEKLQFVFYIIDIFIWWYIINTYIISTISMRNPNENPPKIFQPKNCQERTLVAGSVGCQQQRMQTLQSWSLPARAGTGRMCSGSIGPLRCFLKKFADDSPGGFSSKWCRKMANITGDLETNIRYLYIFLSLVQRTIGNHRNFMQIVPTISPIQSGGWEHQLPAMCCREL